MNKSATDTPDFESGVALAELPEGRMIKGQVDGEKVVLVRSGDEYFALEAACTHMGAPLAEGTVVEGCLHCPWHHARFSLRTGEAIAAPAFSTLKRYETRIQGDLITVSRPPGDSAPHRRSTSATPRTVIIGAGAAGYACAELLARHGSAARVTLIGDDENGSYDRTMCSKQYLAGLNMRREVLLPALPDDVRRLTDHVERIDTEKQQILTRGGESVSYDALVIATGATPRRPALPGFDRPNVFLLRTLSDADRIIEAARAARRVAIIGASFIGLEVAAALKQRKLDVAVIAPGKIPLEKVVGAEVGSMIRRVHEEHGVHFHLQREAREYDGQRIRLDHGLHIDADFIVLGVGVTPDTHLAQDAGLSCAPEDQGGGVIVDEFLTASVSGIYAVGDIASYPDARTSKRLRVEHWVHAQRQGQYVARALLGGRTRFSDEPFFWSAHFDTGLRFVGHVSQIRRTDTEGSVAERSFTLRLSGLEAESAFVTCNRDISALLVEADLEHCQLRR